MTRANLFCRSSDGRPPGNINICNNSLTTCFPLHLHPCVMLTISCTYVSLYMSLRMQQLCAITFTWLLLLFRFHQTSINMSSYIMCVCVCIYLTILTLWNYSIICVDSCWGFVLSCYKLTWYKFIVYIARQWLILGSCSEHIICSPRDIHPHNKHLAQRPTLVACLWMLPLFATGIHHVKCTRMYYISNLLWYVIL